MPDRPEYCPFLNRAESRCGQHFSLDGLAHTLAYCFDRYAQCPVYQDLVLQRRRRQTSAGKHAGHRFVEISLPRLQPSPDSAGISAPSGV